MVISVLGVNHQSPLDIREKVSLNKGQIPSALNALMNVEGVSESVIISTCNRTEFYMVSSENNVMRSVSQWLTEQFLITELDQKRFFYIYEDQKAIRHLMEVASGLDSAVIGETQILGQVKDSYALALSEGTTKKTFNKLFQKTIQFAKGVHTKYRVNDNSLSTNYLVGQYIKNKIPLFKEQSVLVIGAGENGRSFIQVAQGLGMKNITVTNRNLEHGRRVATDYGVQHVHFEKLANLIANYRVVFTSTAAEGYVLDLSTIENALSQRNCQTDITIFDCAVPRDIDPTVGQLEGVTLVNLDMLTEIKHQNENLRLRLKDQIQQDIYIATQTFESWLLEMAYRNTKALQVAH